MKQVKWFRALGLAVITLAVSHTLTAQGDTAAIQQRLNSQFRLTTTASDRSDIVTAGDVVTIHRPGLIMYSVASPMPPSNTYKNGRIVQGWSGFGKDLAITMLTPGGGTSANYSQRPFAPEEKCWVTGMQAQKDGVSFQLYSDPYDGIRYYGNLKIPFPNKKEIPSVDAAMQLVSEVLTGDNQGGQQAAEPSTPPDSSQAQVDQSSGVAGRYFEKGKSSDFLQLAPNGTFFLFQNGKTYTGTYTAVGEIVTITGAKIKGQPQLRVVDNNLTYEDGTIYEKQIEPQRPAAAPYSYAPAPSMPAPAASSVSAPPPPPMQEIAPPPPPADATPPTIEVGQTIDQVTTGFGQPLRVAKLGVKTIYYYKDMKVTFTNGKVSNVE